MSDVIPRVGSQDCGNGQLFTGGQYWTLGSQAPPPWSPPPPPVDPQSSQWHSPLIGSQTSAQRPCPEVAVPSSTAHADTDMAAQTQRIEIEVFILKSPSSSVAGTGRTP